MIERIARYDDIPVGIMNKFIEEAEEISGFLSELVPYLPNELSAYSRMLMKILCVTKMCSDHLERYESTDREKIEYMNEILIVGNRIHAGSTAKLSSILKKTGGLADFPEFSEFHILTEEVQGRAALHAQMCCQCYLHILDGKKNPFFAKNLVEVLDRRIIRQDDAKREAALLVQYHYMRQLNPELPVRSLLISGPSGCGKTEIFRVLKEECGIPVKIIDCTMLTSEGFKGEYKISSIVNDIEQNGGMPPIFIFDEFDELCSVRMTGDGENVNRSIQGEFLKLLECEYPDASIVRSSSFVFLGAFETISMKELKHGLGFGAKDEEDRRDCISVSDLIRYGMRVEIANRITSLVQVHSLSLEDYIAIGSSPDSSIQKLSGTFRSFGIRTEDILTEDVIRRSAEYAMDNKLGVRGMVKDLESRLMGCLMSYGDKRERESPAVMEQSC